GGRGDYLPTSSVNAYEAPGANLSADAAGSQIYVGNLPFSTTAQDLIDLFRSCGNILRAEHLEMGGRSKGSGIVRFDNADEAERAIAKFHGYMYGGRPLDVHLDKFA
ncbi:hypothetical protein BZG36_04594, partial [Bifiguratus adelaidae]